MNSESVPSLPQAKSWPSFAPAEYPQAAFVLLDEDFDANLFPVLADHFRDLGVLDELTAQRRQFEL